jgi:hypothetical protein
MRAVVIVVFPQMNRPRKKIRRTKGAQDTQDESAGGGADSFAYAQGANVNNALPEHYSALSAMGLEGNFPTALTAMMVCLFSTPADGKPAENQKGPHRRCFVCPRIFRLAGIATGGVNSRYLTEILTKSRVGGHTWARATLGKTGDKNIRGHNQGNFSSYRCFFHHAILFLNDLAQPFNYVEQTGEFDGHPHPYSRFY